MQAFHNEGEITPQDVIISCLNERLITAYRCGRVYSNRIGKNLGCLSSRGYLVCTLRYKGIRKQAKMHQIVWNAFRGPIPEGKILDHIDGNKTNNALENLRLVTPKENSRNRRSYLGEANPAARLCLDEANEIRRLYRSGFSYSDLAEAFSVSRSLVAAIIRGEVWV